MKLYDLLKRWAALEPDRCRYNEEAIDVLLRLDIDAWMSIHSPKIADPANGGSGEFYGHHTLQGAVQEATISRRALYRLESTVEGHHHATLLDLQNGCHAIGDDREPAIAMLQAYVSYLEQVAAKGEAIAS